MLLVELWLTPTSSTGTKPWVETINLKVSRSPSRMMSQWTSSDYVMASRQLKSRTVLSFMFKPLQAITLKNLRNGSVLSVRLPLEQALLTLLPGRVHMVLRRDVTSIISVGKSFKADYFESNRNTFIG